MKYLFIALVFILAFSACTQSPEGEKAQTADAQAVEATSSEAEIYKVVADSSSIAWEGTEPGDEGHSGTLKIQGGELQVLNNKLAGGRFVLDMNSISVLDLTGDRKAKLEKHLKTGDFFETEKFPTGVFEITEVTPSGDSESGAYTISGNLGLRDSVKNISFPATIKLENGKLHAETPKFTIDRTEWGVVYRSGIIGTIKDKLINDNIGLKIDLKAGK